MEPIQTVLKQPEKLPIAPKPKKPPVERVSVQKPPWFVNSRAATYPPDFRVVCPRCFGHGSSARVALDRVTDTETGEVTERGCIACWEGYAEGPCPAHKCPICDGSGVVCPQCRGDRVVRRDLEWGHPDFGQWPDEHHATGQYMRCDVCCEGNGINPDREAAAIRRWLVKHPAPQW
jgi:hypothetical protein